MYISRHHGCEAPTSFGSFLVSAGYISSGELFEARTESMRLNCSVISSLQSTGRLNNNTLSQASARFLRLGIIDIVKTPPDPTLAALFDPALLLRFGVLPWQKEAEKTVLLCANHESYRSFLSHVDTDPSQFEIGIAKHDEIFEWLIHYHNGTLVSRASARVSENESCRTWEVHTSRRRLAMTLFGISALLMLVAIFPHAVLGLFSIWAIVTLFISAIMRLSAYVAEVSTDPGETPPPCPQDQLPTISVLIPLFKEREIVSDLLKRLSKLTYPKALLDVNLVVETNDALTKSALENYNFPKWMRVIEVPEGAPKTKPRAMNYALDFCKGDIVGIWDAEDAPAPDQLEVVASRFHVAGTDLVCLQGILDYYNSKQNWLARCFTIEYAAWFRLILPGMSKLGLAIPLGGTTLFFKRDVLEALGGWDAHNVTEDADLGFRLARHDYRTDVIPTRTGEEANCRLWPWVRQRSRWLKGYMVTYLVHMRKPSKLLKQLGLWRFIGFQAHFLTALSQFVLAPVLWSFWLVLFGLPHPLEAFVSHNTLVVLGLSFLAIELINALINATAVSKSELRHLFFWVPTMHFYYPLGAIAAYKALFELIVKPFYWDKTQHGLSVENTRRGKLNESPASFGGIKFEARNKSF
ncbi:glycosyltransferase [Lentibacter algarum]|uniref:glycosyltransferase n=1 Tax=Lentibacter algarum TaxID=576131 RepID=UPI003BAE627E